MAVSGEIVKVAIEAHATQPRARAVGLRRLVAFAFAAQLVVLGLYPGPLILLRDPASRMTHVVRLFVDERLFWILGLVLIIAPVVLVAHVRASLFDETWVAARARIDRIRDRWFMVSVAVVASMLAAGAAVYVFSRKPTSSDEIAQLWHARILLTGRLSLPADPNPEFFAVDNIVDQGGWYSQFPIGGPVLLAVAMALRATWLLNPLLAGLIVANLYRFASRAFGRDEARLCAVFAAVSPYLLIMSGSYMNHPFVAFFTTLALAELPAWTDGTDAERRRASVLIGLSLGAAIAVRPLDGVVTTLAFGGFLVREALRRRSVNALAITVAAGAVPIAVLLLANQLTTGSPLRFGYDVIWGTNHSLGFHTDPLGTAHTPARALRSLITALLQLNWSLFGWPFAGLLVVAGALLGIGTLRRWEIVLLAWIELHLIAYAAYWSEGHFLGPRYLFTLVCPFLILAARGIVVGVRSASPRARRTLIAGIGASMLGAWVMPRPPFGPLGEARAARPLRAALKMDLDPAIESLNGQPALVFVTEPASLRLARRLWGLGISRPDAIRLVGEKDHCALLDAAVDAGRRPGTPSERLARLEETKRYSPAEGGPIVAPDPAFRISSRASISPYCWVEAATDRGAGQAISYGPTMLRNEIGPDGRISGQVVFVADMGEHNEVLRGRFGDRPWYRLRLATEAAGRAPQLIPYR